MTFGFLRSNKNDPPPVLTTPRGAITIVPACPAAEIAAMSIDPGLGFFWHNRPDLQHEALAKIAGLPCGRVTVAHTAERMIIGYVTVALPDEDTRWGRDRIEDLYELGGIEVGRAWRGCGISRGLMEGMFGNGVFDKAVVLATGYRWCWDYESSGMGIREYREMLHKLMQRYGFQFFETDEPNIAWYPDNALIARIGKRAGRDLQAQFKGLLFENLGSEYVMSEFVRK